MRASKDTRSSLAILTLDGVLDSTHAKLSGPIPVSSLMYVSWQPFTRAKPKSIYFCSLSTKPPRMKSIINYDVSRL